MTRWTVAAAVAILLAVAGLRSWEAGAAARAGHPAIAQASASAVPPLVSSGPRFDGARAWSHLTQLVGIGPRPAGSLQSRQTRAYITRQLASMGLTVEEQPFTADTPLGPVAMSNLMVRLPGHRTDRILWTGHYDTKLLPDQVFVGASDGASSAAFLIELARALKDRPREFTHEIVWFDGEEAFVQWMGYDHTYGSRYYVDAARRAGALPSLRAMVLVDMIGARDLHIRRDNGSTPWLTDLIWAAARRIGQGRVFLDADTQVEDDHGPFLQAGVPAVDIIDLDYPPWHTPDDDLAHVSQASLQAVGDVLLAAMPDLEAVLARPPR
jgi:glutaminyl-peptide cyclotransferase